MTKLNSVLVVALWIGASSLAAIAPFNRSGLSKLAIKGYDPVSYFESGEAAKGMKQFELGYGEAKWRFVSQHHLDLFKADPEKYAPQYGGYCAWAVSQGYTDAR
jgi:hypothetical protein